MGVENFTHNVERQYHRHRFRKAFDTVFQTIRLDREYLYQPEEDNCKGCCGIQIGCR